MEISGSLPIAQPYDHMVVHEITERKEREKIMAFATIAVQIYLASQKRESVALEEAADHMREIKNTLLSAVEQGNFEIDIVEDGTISISTTAQGLRVDLPNGSPVWLSVFYHDNILGNCFAQKIMKRSNERQYEYESSLDTEQAVQAGRTVLFEFLQRLGQ